MKKWTHLARPLFISIIIFCPPMPALNAQEYGYKNFTVADGLPSSMVYCISKDKDGRLWFGTQFGVSIFNGNTFKNIGREDGLKETEVFLIYHDSRDIAWFCPFGHGVWYFQNGAVHSISEPPEKGSLFLTHKRKIFEDHNGDIWYLGRDAFRIRNDSIVRIINGKSYLFFNYLYDSNAQLNLVSENGLIKYKNDTLENPLFPDPIIPTSICRGVCRIGQNFYYYLNSRIILLQFDDSGRITIQKTYNWKYDINRIKSLDDKNIWLLSEGHGAFHVNLTTGDTTKFLTDKSVSDVILDDEGNFWFSTLDKGIFKVNKTLVKIYNKPAGLASDEIITVTSDGNKTIWAGTSKGTINLISDFVISGKKLDFDEGNNRIMDVKTDNRGNMYVASDNGLYRFNKFQNKIAEEKTTFKTFKCIHIHSDSIIYTGSATSCLKLRANDLYRENEWKGRTTAIAGFDDLKILIGTIEGLYFISSDSSRIFQLPEYRVDEKINYVVKGKNNVVWVATHSAGVFALDGKRRRQFSTVNGLLSNSCKHIFSDTLTGDIWISTNQGLNKIEPSWSLNGGYHISGFTMDDGLPSNEINQTFVEGSHVWIATANGLALMQNYSQQPEQKPKIFIREISVQDSTYLNPLEINLPHWNNSLGMVVEGLSLSAGKRISYKYKLSGLEQKWNFSSDNLITYAPLPPGNYELAVIAMHPHAGIESSPAIVKITIRSPFWKKGWFITGVLISAASCLFIIYRKRLKRIKRESEVKNQLLQLEITSIRAQMNPHFIFNSLNSIQDFIFKNQKELANEYLSSFSGLMRMVLDNSNTNFIVLSREIEFLRSYLKLEQLRLNHKFEYSIEADEGINTWEIEIPTMILQPLVENAVIHGISRKLGKGKITVRFKLKENVFSCIVEDDGTGRRSFATNGFTEGENHKSFGIKAINERINILNNMNEVRIQMSMIDLKSELQHPSGTRIELDIVSLNQIL